MLFELQIKDFILIHHTKVLFDSGLNVLTGETGAGKSMVIGALNLVLGGQASKEMVRLGADFAQIKASFYTDNKINEILLEKSIPIDEDLVCVSREVYARGKSIARVNGQIVTLQELKSISPHLLDIHGQMDNQTLLLKDYQLNVLDVYGGSTLLDLKWQIRKTYDHMRTLKKDLAQLLEKSSDRLREMDFLAFQLDEIEAANLVVDEDVTLEKEYDFLSQIENISDSVEHAVTWFSGEYGEGAVSIVSSLGSAFSKLAHVDGPIEDFSIRLKELYYLMDDLSKDIVRYRDRIEKDPERMAYMESRLDEINRLKLKYGNTISAILDYKRELEVKRDDFSMVESRIEEKKGQLERVESDYELLASKLSSIRKEAAQSFTSAVLKELNQLNMKDAQFEIAFDLTPSPTASGNDVIEFVISTNLGQPFKPLRKVVSGGELSRLMLAIKIVLGDADKIASLVFDEIDAGISGITANVVGEKLAKLSCSGQVICITHLPQIAVYADHHMLIKKELVNGVTSTEIETLVERGAENEIARLVGGQETTEVTYTHAREMLIHAKKIKLSI